MSANEIDNDLTLTLMNESFRDRWRRIITGLRAPKDSGEYKYARFMMLRIFGPSTIAIVVSALVVLTMFTLAIGTTLKQDQNIEVTVMTPETVKLEDIKIEEIKPEEIEITEPLDNSIQGPPSDYATPSETPGVGVDGDMDTPMVAFAPVMTKSPLVMKNLYGNRTKGGIDKALRSFGGSGITEAAVNKALQWLKKHQNADGSWPREPIACTGLALLTYLAHGETPTSPEYGQTVEKALKYLVSKQNAKGLFSGNPYSHGIATYAISEAYAMTKIMALRDAMEKGIQAIIDGQQERGGFDYGYGKTDRWDLSVAGWQYQAMKAARMAGSGNADLDAAIKKSIRFLKEWAFTGTGWGYSGNNKNPGSSPTPSMTGAGTLALQLLGHAKSSQVKAGIEYLSKWEFVWPKKDAKGGEGSGAKVYAGYYITQAKFQEGGATWTAWNKAFAPELVMSQKEDGHWEGGDWEATPGPVYTTCLSALMLQVYYRYLPTFSHVEDSSSPEPTATSSDDIVVKVL